tara:strand:- start:487 stop:642 length:156 start_codon:yes stop_codon:yes gene_type:complete
VKIKQYLKAKLTEINAQFDAELLSSGEFEQRQIFINECLQELGEKPQWRKI